MTAQWQLKKNMCAEYIRVDPNNTEVKQLVPTASDEVVRVKPKEEDCCFATALAHVVLEHVEGLAKQLEQQPGDKLMFAVAC